MSATILRNCAKRLDVIFKQSQVDQTHGLSHALAVLNHGVLAVESEDNIGANQKDNILLACLLHDADDRKYFPKNMNYENARFILSQEKVDAQNIENIIGMISVVSFSKNGDNYDANKPKFWYYPRYCDRIEAIGIKGLVRAYQYAKVVKNPLLCNNTKRPVTEEQLKGVCSGRQEQYMRRGGKSESFIDHIYDKLLHLKVPQFIKNEYIVSQYQKGYRQISDFVLKQAKQNFENTENEIQALIKKCEKQKVNSQTNLNRKEQQTL